MIGLECAQHTTRWHLCAAVFQYNTLVILNPVPVCLLCFPCSQAVPIPVNPLHISFVCCSLLLPLLLLLSLARAKVYNGVLDAFAHSKEWARASDILREMASAGHELHARSYRGLIVSAANAGKWSVTWRAFCEMTSLGVEKSSRSPVIYNAVSVAAGAAGKWEEALCALRLTVEGGMAPTLIACNATLGALGKAGQWEHAQRILKDMQRASAGSGVGRDDRGNTGGWFGSNRSSARQPLPPPNVYSYTSVIDACGKSGELGLALEILEDMRRARVSPNLVTFNTLILRFGDPGGGSGQQGEGGGDARRALSFLEEMVKEGIRPDAYTLTVVVAACDAGGEWEKAAILLKELLWADAGARKEQGGAAVGASAGAAAVDLVLAQLAIIACGKTNNWRGGLEVMRDVERVGAPPDVGVYNALIEALIPRPQQQQRNEKTNVKQHGS